MTKSSTYWDNRALKRLSEAETISDKHIAAIKRMYEQAFRNVENEITRIYKNYSKETGLDVQKLKELLTKKETDKVWKTLKRQGLDQYIQENYKSRISRLEQIQAQIYAKAKMIYPKEELEQTMCYKGVINQSYYKAIYDTQIGTGYDFPFNTIDQRTIDTLLNERWSGKNYSQRIWGNTDILAETLSQYVGAALLSGQSIEKTSKQIRDRFNTGKYYSERLVRTETNYFNNQADAMAYQELGIDKYVFVATLDSRTSEICQEMDNKVFDYDKMSIGENFPPLHPNCRSKTRGYLGEEAEKLLQRRARNPITGEVELVDNIPYSEWIKQYNEKVMTNNTKSNDTIVITNDEKQDKKVMTNNKKRDTISNTSRQKLSINDFPSNFRDGKEAEYTQIAVDYINSLNNADERIINLFKRMGQIEKLPFKISHAQNHSLSITTKNDIIDNIKLTIPKVSRDNLDSIGTWIHENIHFIDFGLNNSDKNKYNEHYSTRVISLKAILQTTTNKSIGPEMQKLFDEYNSKCKEIEDKYSKPILELNEYYRNNKDKMSYKDYKQQYDEKAKLYKNNVEIEQRNILGRTSGSIRRYI